MNNSEKTWKIVALQRRGFVYPGSEIYGGLSNHGITSVYVELKII